ncbi:type II toxin-antitoxin system Phd/YefM family antitoxin [Patescibacteria group bacterium]|nr:type II toxin-antitoxin system Phd/YefM family antitoxin [Patescibacteria group bacterium]MCL5010237.1 type II toxin-antitoxin system Phd/YefM family antitoxin [Patescibacteria group bacterium]
MNTLSIPASKARANFFDLLTQVEQAGQILITRYGKVKAVLVNPDELEGFEETREILAIKGALASIRRGEKQIKKGEIVPFTKIDKKFWQKTSHKTRNG